jgi:hypothetical protein
MFSQAHALLQRLIDHILHDGLGPFSRNNNPALYGCVLVALAISLLFGVANFVVIRARHGRNGQSVGLVLTGEVSVLVQEVLFIYFIWLAYATPFGRLPFGPPGDSWAGAYFVVAVVVHGLLGIVGTYFLTVAWLIQLNAPLRNARVAGLALASGILLAIFGWEVQRWPLGFTIPAELTLNVIVAYALLIMLLGRFARQVNLLRFEFCFFILLVMAGTAFIWLDHAIDPYFLNVYGVFSVLILFDDLVACFAAVFKEEDPKALYRFLSPMRWVITVPAVLFFAGVAASGYFSPLISNSSVTYTIWVEVGTAAAAYMLFRPLTDDARAPLATLAADIALRIGPPSTPRRLLSSGAPGSQGMRGQIIDADPDTPPNLSDNSSIEAAGNAARGTLQDASPAARQLFQGLDFPAFVVFLLVTYGYHFLFANVDFGSQANSEIVPVGFGAAALVANIVALLINDRLLRRTAYTSMLLLLITIAVTLVAVMMVLIPGANGPLTTNGIDPVVLLTSVHFRLVTIHNLVQDFLILLTAGQLIYLFQVIRVAMKQPIYTE